MLAKAARRSLSTSAYSSGLGFLGCLGHGGFTDEFSAQKIDFNGEGCKQVAAGWGHSAVLMNDGQVLVFGRTHDFKSVLSLAGMHNRLPWVVYAQNWASGGSGVEALNPKLAPLPEGEIAVSVACSAAVTAITTESGKVFCFGLNHHGQCGNGNDNVRVWEPELVQGFGGEHVVQVSLGFSHALAVTESGRAFSWGKGERGQLGRVENKQKLVAEPIITTDETHDLTFVEVGAGFSHSMARTACGKVLCWGKLQGVDATDPEQSVYTDQKVLYCDYSQSVCTQTRRY
jgi:alpha-tubulin suppressor-like RCC1 family protein